MRGPWAAWKAWRARRAKLDAIVVGLALLVAEDCVDQGRRVDPVFDLSDREGLATVTPIRLGVRPAGTPRARHRRRPSA